MARNENAPELGGSRGGERMCDRSKIIPFPIHSRNGISGLHWRRSRGLETLTDLSADYEAIREPRGAYSVSLPEDFVA